MVEPAAVRPVRADAAADRGAVRRRRRARRARRRWRRWRRWTASAGSAPPPPAAAALPAAQVEATRPSPRHPPGWYGTPGRTHGRGLSPGAEPRRRDAGAAAGAAAAARGRGSCRSAACRRERDLGPWLLAAALLLLAADLLIALRLRGLLRAAPARRRWRGCCCWPRPGAGAAPGRGAGAGHPPGLRRHRRCRRWTRRPRRGWWGCPTSSNRRTAAALAEPAAVVPGRTTCRLYPAALLGGHGRTRRRRMPRRSRR